MSSINVIPETNKSTRFLAQGNENARTAIWAEVQRFASENNIQDATTLYNNIYYNFFAAYSKSEPVETEYNGMRLKITMTQGPGEGTVWYPKIELLQPTTNNRPKPSRKAPPPPTTKPTPPPKPTPSPKPVLTLSELGGSSSTNSPPSSPHSSPISMRRNTALTSPVLPRRNGNNRTTRKNGPAQNRPATAKTNNRRLPGRTNSTRRCTNNRITYNNLNTYSRFKNTDRMIHDNYKSIRDTMESVLAPVSNKHMLTLEKGIKFAASQQGSPLYKAIKQNNADYVKKFITNAYSTFADEMKNNISTITDKRIELANTGYKMSIGISRTSGKLYVYFTQIPQEKKRWFRGFGKSKSATITPA